MRKFADECESILRSIIQADPASISPTQISEETDLPVVQVVDLINNYMDKQIVNVNIRFRGIKTVEYALRRP